jgi:hypothetical protein
MLSDLFEMVAKVGRNWRHQAESDLGDPGSSGCGRVGAGVDGVIGAGRGGVEKRVVNFYVLLSDAMLFPNAPRLVFMNMSSMGCTWRPKHRDGGSSTTTSPR